jgi:hypothetical protein
LGPERSDNPVSQVRAVDFAPRGVVHRRATSLATLPKSFSM